mgnify:CR=1 FL=1|jgi:hypothetical protein
MTKRRLKKIRVLRTALISALIFFFISLIVFVPMLIITGITGGLPGGMGFGKAALPIIIMPLLYPIMGFLMTALWCWLYNVIAQRIGGIEFEDEVIEQ